MPVSLHGYLPPLVLKAANLKTSRKEQCYGWVFLKILALNESVVHHIYLLNGTNVANNMIAYKTKVSRLEVLTSI